MKNNTWCIVLILMIILQSNIAGSIAQTVSAIKFDKLAPGLQKDIPQDLSIEAKLKIDTVQIVTNEGFKFSILLENTSDKDISIYNVVDALSPHLYNASYLDVIIPHMPYFMVCYGRSFISNTPSLLVGKTLRNGTEVAVDYTKTENITIPAKGSYEIHLAIKTVLKNPVPAETSQQGNEATITLRDQDPNGLKTELLKGRYMLGMYMGLYERPVSESSFRISLKIPETVVEYGL